MDITTIVSQLMEKLPALVRSASVVYAPALQRMINEGLTTEVTAIQELLLAGDSPAAQAALRKTMTMDELADEKEMLGIALEAMAQASIDQAQLISSINSTIINLAITAALAAI